MDEPPVMPVVQPLEVATRCCTKCGEVKAETEFYISGGRRIIRCRKCVLSSNEQWRQRNAESQLIARREQWHKRRKINSEMRRKRYHERRDEMRLLGKRRYAENKHKWVEWKQCNRALARAADKRYKEKLRREQPERFKEISIIRSTARRARLLNAPGKMSHGLKRKLMSEQKYKCVYCPADLRVSEVHMDHIIPLALGGTNHDINFQLTCALCNRMKAAKHPLDFAAEMGVVQNPLLIAI